MKTWTDAMILILYARIMEDDERRWTNIIYIVVGFLLACLLGIYDRYNV